MWEKEYIARDCRGGAVNQVEQEEEGADVGQVGWGGITGDCYGVGDINVSAETKPMEVHMRGEKEREARKKEREADQGNWEILQAEKQQIRPEWRKKIQGGHQVTFVLHSGAVRTISPPGSVPGAETYRTKLTGKNFRSA